MRQVLFIYIILLIAFSCTQKKQKKAENPCISDIQEVQKTSKLAVGDSLRSYGGHTEGGQLFSIYDLKGDYMFLYFKKIEKNKEGYIPLMFSLNEEIDNKPLLESVKKKKGDVIINNDLKMANIYGIELEHPTNLKHSALFVADKNKIITHIYIDLCEDDIINIVNQL